VSNLDELLDEMKQPDKVELRVYSLSDGLIRAHHKFTFSDKCWGWIHSIHPVTRAKYKFMVQRNGVEKEFK